MDKRGKRKFFDKNQTGTVVFLVLAAITALFFTKQFGIVTQPLGPFIFLLLIAGLLFVAFRLIIASSPKEQLTTEDFVLMLLSAGIIIGILFLFGDKLFNSQFAVFQDTTKNLLSIIGVA